MNSQVSEEVRALFDEVLGEPWAVIVLSESSYIWPAVVSAALSLAVSAKEAEHAASVASALAAKDAIRIYVRVFDDRKAEAEKNGGKAETDGKDETDVDGRN